MSYCSNKPQLVVIKPKQARINKEKDRGEPLLRKITNYVLKHRDDLNIRYGDLIHIGEDSFHRYRNEWVFGWDGTEAVWLDYEESDYGYPPKEFQERFGLMAYAHIMD